MVRKIIFQYVGMPEKSEFSEEPLIPSSGKEIEKKVAFDEYNISILAPQEAAERFQKWLQHAVIRNNSQLPQHRRHIWCASLTGQVVTTS